MAVVQTVLGPIDPNTLGRTLTHEHLFLNCEKFYVEGPYDFKPYLSKKVCLENLGFVRQYPFSVRDNLHFHDEAAQEAVLKDVQLYKKFLGGAIVDNSSHGLTRNLEFMVDLSKKTGIHIISGTGHYVHSFQGPEHLNMKVEDMTDLYTRDIVTGTEVENVGMVKSGLIGEVGSGYPLHDFEKRAIRATGEVQEVLGCAVSFHPGGNPEAPFEIMRLYLEAGGRAEKCALSHLDRTIFDMDKLLEFAKFGSYIQYDSFGTEMSYFQIDPKIDMPSDAQRINHLIKLVKEGYVNRLLVSHDMHAKHMLTSYGGFGYHHLHMNVVPRMFERGMNVDQVERITVTNPAEWLQFNI